MRQYIAPPLLSSGLDETYLVVQHSCRPSVVDETIILVIPVVNSGHIVWNPALPMCTPVVGSDTSSMGWYPVVGV